MTGLSLPATAPPILASLPPAETQFFLKELWNIFAALNLT